MRNNRRNNKKIGEITRKEEKKLENRRNNKKIGELTRKRRNDEKIGEIR
jgi:hypothetical protein